jgi:hypothetical protein
MKAVLIPYLLSELAPGRENTSTRETPQNRDAYDKMVQFAGDVKIPCHKEHLSTLVATSRRTLVPIRITPALVTRVSISRRELMFNEQCTVHPRA